MQGRHGAPVLEIGDDAGRLSVAKCARLAALSKRSAERLIALAPAQAWFLGMAALVRNLTDAIAIGMDKGRSSHRALRAGFSSPLSCAREGHGLAVSSGRADRHARQ